MLSELNNSILSSFFYLGKICPLTSATKIL